MNPIPLCKPLPGIANLIALMVITKICSAYNCDIFGVYHNWLQSDAAFVYPRLDSTA